MEKVRKTINSVLSSNLVDVLYLVDNSPTRELEVLAFNHRIIYIFNNKNIGFGAGHNVILRKPDNLGKYHIILNPDIYFDKNSIDIMLNYMNSNSDIGLLMPKVLYPDGSIQYLCKLLPTPMDWFLRMFIPFKSLKEKLNNRFELKFTGYDKIMNIPYLSGCFMLIRSSILEDVGFFDERFFMYAEDTDFSRRINAKYKTVYYPEAFIYHEFNKGSHKKFKLFWFHIKSTISYFNKWGWLIDRDRKNINREILRDEGLL